MGDLAVQEQEAAAAVRLDGSKRCQFSPSALQQLFSLEPHKYDEMNECLEAGKVRPPARSKTACGDKSQHAMSPDQMARQLQGLHYAAATALPTNPPPAQEWKGLVQVDLPQAAAGRRTTTLTAPAAAAGHSHPTAKPFTAAWPNG